MNEAGKVDGSPIVAHSETAKMLETTEASLDSILLFVELSVVRDEGLAIALDGITACASI